MNMRKPITAGGVGVGRARGSAAAAQADVLRALFFCALISSATTTQSFPCAYAAGCVLLFAHSCGSQQSWVYRIAIIGRGRFISARYIDRETRDDDDERAYGIITAKKENGVTSVCSVTPRSPDDLYVYVYCNLHLYSRPIIPPIIIVIIPPKDILSAVTVCYLRLLLLSVWQWWWGLFLSHTHTHT